MATLYLRKIPEELKRRMKVKAAENGVTLEEDVLSVIERYCAMDGGPAAPVTALNASRERTLEPEGDFEKCGYREWSSDLGEFVTCGLPAHGARIRHGAWRK